MSTHARFCQNVLERLAALDSSACEDREPEEQTSAA